MIQDALDLSMGLDVPFIMCNVNYWNVKKSKQRRSIERPIMIRVILNTVTCPEVKNKYSDMAA